MVMFSTGSADLKNMCQSKHFQALEEAYQVEAIQAVPKQKALKLLTEEIRFLHFAPDSIMVMWQPCGWCHSTLAEQFMKSHLYVSKCPISGRIVAFSFHTVRETDAGPWAMVDFYGDVQGQHGDLVISHMLYHIREMSLIQGYPKLTCTYQFPKEVDRDQVVSILNEKLGLRLMDLYKEAMLFSTDIKSMSKPKNKL